MKWEFKALTDVLVGACSACHLGARLARRQQTGPRVRQAVNLLVPVAQVAPVTLARLLSPGLLTNVPVVVMLLVPVITLALLRALALLTVVLIRVLLIKPLGFVAEPLLLAVVVGTPPQLHQQRGGRGTSGVPKVYLRVRGHMH